MFLDLGEPQAGVPTLDLHGKASINDGCNMEAAASLWLLAVIHSGRTHLLRVKGQRKPYMRAPAGSANEWRSLSPVSPAL